MLGENFVTSSADELYNLNRQRQRDNNNRLVVDSIDAPKTYFDNCQQTSNKNNIPKSYRYGELPKYLKTMKEKNQLESQRIALIDPNCPYGHIPLSTAERLETLEIAKQKINQLIEELNRMSLTSKSIKIKQRKTEIERELNHLEDNIKIFSKSKVYVRID